MKTPLLLSLGTLVSIFSFYACENDKVEHSLEFYSKQEYEVLRATLDLPANPLSYGGFFFEGFSNNADHIGTLGRVLFYDTKLSKDQTVSCGSCHQQHLAFADDKAFSTGIENRTTARNSLALGVFQNFGNYQSDPTTTLFWDGRVDNLREQMLQTIANPNEMGMEMKDIVERIRNIDYYRVLTEKAFGTPDIHQEMIFEALTTFMSSITSNFTKFDMVAHSTPFFATENAAGFSTQENLGKSLFRQHCSGCHGEGMNGLTQSNQHVLNANNGLDITYADKGAGEVNPSPSAVGVFKVPSLRNVMLTSPYMHDGRFDTIEEVLDFYSTGIQDHANLHALLKTNNEPIKFNFTGGEKDALIQFFSTLTDFSMAQEEKWSDPFF